MEFLRKITLVLAVGLLLAGCRGSPEQTAAPPEPDTSKLTELDLNPDSDVPYVPTPPDVVDKMLELAGVTSADTVFDLGSGDGRIVIRAAEKYGAHGVGIDIDPNRVREARRNARAAGVSDLVTFHEGDLFELDLSSATVVTLYLLPELNEKLRPKLFRQLPAGTPIVSHSFGMGEWQPERQVNVDASMVYLWTIPEDPPEYLNE